MAKYSKLTKLKSSVMKKWSSFGRTSSSSISAATSSGDDISTAEMIQHNNNDKYFPVYVGKSRRRYLVDSETAANPIFRELLERSLSSSESSSESESAVIACEVVLFDHLLWMLRNCNNASAADWQVRELVELYAC